MQLAHDIISNFMWQADADEWGDTMLKLEAVH
jgi:hypothetical protein